MIRHSAPSIDNVYTESYNTLTTMMLICIISIPVVLCIVLITNRIVQGTTVTQNLISSNDDVLKDVPHNINEKCKNYVRWVYSYRNIDPLYGLCNIQTTSDAYKWVVCNKPQGCNDIIDPKIDCSTLHCRSHLSN